MKAIPQTRFLAMNYTALQGLRIIPLGLCLLLVSLWANAIPSGPARDLTIPILCALACLLAYIITGQYYKHSFGEVKQTITRRHLEQVVMVVGGMLALAAFWLDNLFDLRICFTGLVLAGALLLGSDNAISGLNAFSITKIGASIWMLVASISPLLFGQSWWTVLGIKSLLLGIMMMCGILMIIEGVITHLFLLSSLPSPRTTDE